MNSAFKLYTSKRMILVFVMGFSSGLPLALTGGTLQAWLTDERISTATIGLFSLVGLPYTCKYLWAPFMERFIPPFMGRRRGWMLICQLLLMVLIFVIGLSKPASWPTLVAFLALCISFVSASQDIVIDAYRAEVLKKEELGAGAGMTIMGYRIAMLTSGAFALVLTSTFAWNQVYWIMACLMLIGVLASFFASEPDIEVSPPKTISEAVIQPFVEYFKRPAAVEILIFVIIYKLGDVMAVALQNNFLLLLGFQKEEIGYVAKGLGLTATILGSLVGGAYVAKLGMKKALLRFGVLQGVAIMAFAVLAYVGKNNLVMASCITIENFCSGLGNAAYIGFLMSLCNKRFTATQYALLTSLGAITRVFAGALTGFVATYVGWIWFFVICTFSAIPGLILVMLRYNYWTTENSEKA